MAYIESAITNKGTSFQEGRMPSVVVTITFLFVQLFVVSDNETSVKLEVRFNSLSFSFSYNINETGSDEKIIKQEN